MDDHLALTLSVLHNASDSLQQQWLFFLILSFGLLYLLSGGTIKPQVSQLSFQFKLILFAFALVIIGSSFYLIFINLEIYNQAVKELSHVADLYAIKSMPPVLILGMHALLDLILLTALYFRLIISGKTSNH